MSTTATPVRRTDYEMTERDQMEKLLAEATHGFLGLTGPDGWPRVVPLNYVTLDGKLYFHGATEGEKMDSLAADDRVTFVVVEDFSLVPSYFRDPKFACPSTQYYKAVAIRGRARIVEDNDEKARALQALMEKLQPEGGYVPITASEPMYRKSLRTTAVVANELDEHPVVAEECLCRLEVPRPQRRTFLERPVPMRGAPRGVHEQRRHAAHRRRHDNRAIPTPRRLDGQLCDPRNTLSRPDRRASELLNDRHGGAV